MLLKGKKPRQEKFIGLKAQLMRSEHKFWMLSQQVQDLEPHSVLHLLVLE